MIQILPSSIANQIAAGEVVERPASVVKELVENALDAGATQIDIQLGNGGKSLIQVTDNGSGMSESDAEKCFLRHATSKIQSIDDLFSIQSFGFRGEALAAISSVSDFEIITCLEGGEGLKITTKDSKITDTASTPANTGTTITIKNLFHNTPARLNYLKRDDAEYRVCMKEIAAFALSNPEVGFRVGKEESGVRSQKSVMDLPAGQKAEDRIAQILKANAEGLMEISGGNSTTKISGWVSTPGQYAGSKNYQYLFVNGRKIEDHRLTFAAREAYVQSCGIEKHLYPLLVLFIDIDPILVDVNVHPRKLEVKFSDPNEIFSLVKGTIIEKLGQSNPSLDRRDDLSGRLPYHPQKPSPKNHHQSSAFNDLLTSSFRDQNQSRDEALRSFPASPLQSSPQSASFPPTAYSVLPTPSPVSPQFLSQLQRKYLLAESPEGLYVFEQHALHERQRFDRLMQQAKTKEIETQALLIPQPLNLPDHEIAILKEHKEDLKAIGLSLDFEDTTVTHVPTLLKDQDLDQLFQDLAEHFSSESTGENIFERLLRKRLEYQACRGSVMFGDDLAPEEAQALLDDFEHSVWKDLCPHGRPNHVFFPWEEVAKWFHR